MAENWDQHRTPVSHDGAGPSSLNPDFSNNLYEGLRVLVYAQKRENLHNYAAYLTSNHYEVYMASSEEDAMNQLCKHSDMFDADIALIEVDKPEGYIFQSINGTIDRPIIIISKDDSKASVMKWLSKGAWDCLIKPSSNDLKYIFKHVVTMRARRSMVAGEKAAGEKSSSLGPNYNGDHSSQASTSKRKRLVWDLALHTKFVEAVNHFGLHKANPKKIVGYMNDPRVTRDHVASHLQKYRQKEKERMELLTISIPSSSTHRHGEVSVARLMPHQLIPEKQNIINSDNLMSHPIPSLFGPYHEEVSVASLMPHQLIPEKQNIINSDNLMSHPIPSSFGPYHEVSVASLMPHQPISEQQNIINSDNPMSHPIPSSFGPYHEVSVASTMPHQPISEQQNIINSNIPMSDPIPSSFGRYHEEVYAASMMPHQPILEKQNIINSNIPMSDPIPSSYQGEASVASVMPHHQYQTTNFSTQPNSNYDSGRTNFRFMNMYDEMSCANGGFGYETDPQLYNTCNVKKPEIACPQVQLFTCNVDKSNVKDPETGSEFINNTSYPDENNN